MFAPFKKKEKIIAERIIIKPEVRKHIGTEQIKTFLRRHENSDWGDVSEADEKMNVFSVRNQLFVISHYHVSTGLLVIQTDGERAQTTVSIQLKEADPHV